MLQIRAEIRGTDLFPDGTLDRAIALIPDQRLILSRDPNNRIDRNAIKVAEITGNSVGYVARRVAAIVAPGMDNGEIWVACVAESSYLVRRSGRWRITWPIAMLERLPDHMTPEEVENYLPFPYG